ncbi:FAD-binding domain-containing protein [Jackrogersella minutella]|nr:FAD-binding domain-containing protein [Jackrogersella minutella]
MLLRLSWFLFGLASPALGEPSSASNNPKSDPILLLKEKGITSDTLSETSSGLKVGDGCFCSLACDTLTSIFGSDSVDIIGQESYEASRSKYWSTQQAKASPRCFVRPIDAEDVSIVILVSRATECPFAIKGGGHTAFKGASNSDGGITIDFRQRKHVVPSADRKSVAIGPGNTWADVYTALESFNLTMAGGRSAKVGVSGLLLGGGISFFSGRHGWACDNIINYEIVLASGEILTVDSTTNPDLFWALRGGGGNFGVVTQFVANTFEQQGPLWGGMLVWEMHSTKKAAIDFLISYTEKGSIEDPNAAFILSFTYAQIYQMWVSTLLTHHTSPSPSGTYPEVFGDLTKIENVFLNTTRMAPHSNFTIELDSTTPIGMRQSYWTFTTLVDGQLALDLLDIFEEEMSPIKDLAGFLPAFVYQIITVPQLKAMTRNGGNALGIGGGDKPLLLSNLVAMWDLESDDALILTAFHNVVSRAEELARERGLDHPYLYMNYASQFQGPFSSYGAENKARLMEVANKYDPEAIFQKLNPGHFKFNGAPSQWVPMI